MEPGKTFLLVTGWQRAGSTRAYNIMRHAADFRAAGGLTYREVDLLAEFAGESLLGKVHNYVPDLRHDHVVPVWCVRNPLDVLTSRLRHPELPSDCGENLAAMHREWCLYKQWANDPRLVTLVYELAFDYVTDKVRGTEFPGTEHTLAVAGLDTAAEVVKRAGLAERPWVVKSQTDKTFIGTYCEVTQRRHKHVSTTYGVPGAWRGVLSKEERDTVLRMFAEAFERFDAQWRHLKE